MYKKNYQIPGAEGRPITFDITLPETGTPAPLIIFLHGFKGFKDWAHWPLVSKALAEKGFAVLKMNFSHNGTTPEHPVDFVDLEAFGRNTFSKELEDIDHVINWLFAHPGETEAIDLNRIYLVAHSRGGAVAIIKAASDDRIKKVVTWSSVSYLDRYTPEELEMWRKQGVVHIHNARTNQDMPLYFSLAEDFIAHREEYSVKNACKKLNKPLLVIHAEKDETVPLDEGKNIAGWTAGATLYIVNNADHSFKGYHPYDAEELPPESTDLVEKTAEFLKD